MALLWLMGCKGCVAVNNKDTYSSLHSLSLQKNTSQTSLSSLDSMPPGPPRPSAPAPLLPPASPMQTPSWASPVFTHRPAGTGGASAFSEDGDYLDIQFRKKDRDGDDFVLV